MDQIISSIQEIKNHFSSRLDKIESEEKYQNFVKTINAKLDMLSKRIEKLEKFKSESEKAARMQERYNKRLNKLIQGVEENKDIAWKTYEKTLKKFNHFLTTALKIGSNKIKVVDVHRLPQICLMKKGKKVNQPIIAKLESALDKSMIFNNLKRLKSCNEKGGQQMKSKRY